MVTLTQVPTVNERPLLDFHNQHSDYRIFPTNLDLMNYLVSLHELRVVFMQVHMFPCLANLVKKWNETEQPVTDVPVSSWPLWSRHRALCFCCVRSCPRTREPVCVLAGRLKDARTAPEGPSFTPHRAPWHKEASEQACTSLNVSLTAAAYERWPCAGWTSGRVFVHLEKEIYPCSNQHRSLSFSSRPCPENLNLHLASIPSFPLNATSTVHTKPQLCPVCAPSWKNDR